MRSVGIPIVKSIRASLYPAWSVILFRLKGSRSSVLFALVVMSKRIIESYRQKLAAEDGWVLKRGAELRIALCYPNVYEIGMANLGFQSMYELFNRIPDVSCERVFLPNDQEMREYDKSRTSLLSLESQSPVRDFDVVAFSISFE